MSDKVNKMGLCRSAALLVSLCIVGNCGFVAKAAKTQQVAISVPLPSYARIADLVTSSKAIPVMIVRKMVALPNAQAPGLGEGMQRFLVTADILSLIRGNDAIARRANFLIDLPGTPKSKPPKWRGRTFIAFGAIQERIDFFQLLSSRALIAWSPQNETLVRRVDAEMHATNAPPIIKDVDSVFHVTGAIKGESETQIFLLTANDSPVSLSIIRKPDEKPLFGVSLGEIVDEAAALPAVDTPLWYRLSCFLPDQLPDRAVNGLSPGDAEAARKDFGAFRQALATCERAAQPIE